MHQEYIPRVGDRVLANSKGTADEGCGAYTDYWFPGEITKVNFTHKIHCIMPGDSPRIIYTHTKIRIALCQVETQGTSARKLYFCDIQFDNGEFEQSTPLVSRNNRNKRRIRPEPAPAQVVIPPPRGPAAPPVPNPSQVPVQGPVQGPAQQTTRTLSRGDDARGRQIVLEDLPAEQYECLGCRLRSDSERAVKEKHNQHFSWCPNLDRSVCFQGDVNFFREPAKAAMKNEVTIVLKKRLALYGATVSGKKQELIDRLATLMDAACPEIGPGSWYHFKKKKTVVALESFCRLS